MNEKHDLFIGVLEKELKNQMKVENTYKTEKKRFHFPQELYGKLLDMYYLRESSAYIIHGIIQVIFDNVCDSNYKMSRKKIQSLIDYLSKLLNCDWSWMKNDEKQYRRTACEYILNLVCNIMHVEGEDNVFWITMSKNDEEILQKYEDMKKNPRYQPLYFYSDPEKEQGKEIYHKVLAQKFGIKFDATTGEQIKPEKITKKESGEDKRIIYNNIDMIDADTLETIYTFTSREECIEQTGINKSTLSDCIRTAKDPNHQSWRKWKDKSNGKKYYFKEICR